MQRLGVLLAMAAAATTAATPMATPQQPLQPPEDDCGLKLRELCHGTTGTKCLACADTSTAAAALREAGCTGARKCGLCLQTRLRVVAGPFGSVAAETALLSVRAGACCRTDGRGDQA